MFSFFFLFLRGKLVPYSPRIIVVKIVSFRPLMSLFYIDDAAQRHLSISSGRFVLGATCAGWSSSQFL